jgi:ribonuclease HI
VPVEAAAALACTEGVCSGNPGSGAGGAVLLLPGSERERSGFEAQTTNTRVACTGAIAALAVRQCDCTVHLHADFRNVCRGISGWVPQWIRPGRKSAGDESVLNGDCRERPALPPARRRERRQWVRGHGGVPINEWVDQLAGECLERQRARIVVATSGAVK